MSDFAMRCFESASTTTTTNRLEDLVNQRKREKLAEEAAEAARKRQEAEAEAQEEYAESLAKLKEILRAAPIPPELLQALEFVRVDPSSTRRATHAAAIVKIHGKKVSISLSNSTSQGSPSFYLVVGDYSSHVAPTGLWDKICDRTAQV